MKNSIWLLACLVSFPAWGAESFVNGGMDGGGGQGVLCEAKGQRTLELLDLYEARNIWGLSIPKSEDVRGEVKRIFPNYLIFSDWGYIGEGNQPPPPPTDQQISDFIKDEFDEFQSRLRPIPKGSRLNLSDDFDRPILQLPDNCRYAQVIFYVDENAQKGQVLVDQEYWSLLTPQDQVALAMHEELYKQLRAFGEKNSYRTRRMIGLIFGEEQYPGRVRGSYGQADPLICYSRTEDYTTSFLVVRHQYGAGREEIGRLLFQSIQSKKFSERTMFVETVGEPEFTFEKWKNWSFDSKKDSSSVNTFFINSALGS